MQSGQFEEEEKILPFLVHASGAFPHTVIFSFSIFPSRDSYINANVQQVPRRKHETGKLEFYLLFNHKTITPG